jgi:hypothetical protein
MKLKPEEIEVGKQYQIEHKYYYCVNATILENQFGKNISKRHSDTWVGWKIKVDTSFGGMFPLKEEDVLDIGWDTKFSGYEITFKEVGSETDYTGFNHHNN